MAKMTLHVAPDATAEHVTLQLDQDGSPLGHINFDPPTVDKHIRDVARARALLLDRVPETLDEGARVEVATDPAWRVFPAANGVGLALRHPGLGWVGFHLSESKAKEIASWLAGLGEIAKNTE